jgi:hypothetical protein
LPEHATAAVDTRLRDFLPGDEAAIQRLFLKVFERRRSDATWAWRFRNAPSGPALIHVLERHGEIVGHIAHVGFPTHAHGGGPIALAHGGDTMVDPGLQGGGLMRGLVEAFLVSDHRFDARMNFPTDKAARLMERYGGGRYLGRIPQWVRAARPAVAASRAGTAMKPVAWLGTAAGRLVSSAPSSAVVETADRTTSEYDDLARASAAFAPFIRVRDARYVTWRWLEEPDTAWTLIEARSVSQLRGWAVIGVDAAEPGLGRIVDLLAADAGTTRALLVEGARRLEARGADRVTVDLNDPRPWAARACLLAGFVRFGTGVNVVSKALSPAVDASIERLDSWYLTRGDSDLA